MEAVYAPIAVVIAAALVASAAIAELVIAVCAIAAELVLATCIMAELLDELSTMAGTTVVSAGEAQANVTASCAARDMPAAEETSRAVVNLILGFFDIGKLLYGWSRTAQRRKQYVRQSRRKRRGGI